MKPMFGRNSKKVYFVDGMKFVSDKGTHNGKSKAVEYCYANMIPDTLIIVFDSEMEYKRYIYLSHLLAENKITNLSIHHRFLLQPHFEDCDGFNHEEITYIADFTYLQDGRMIVEDVKGYEEPEFKLKEKLFNFVHLNMNMRIKKVRLKSRCDYLLNESWEELSEIKGRPKKTTTKLREQNAQMKKELQNAQKRAKELQKIRERYFILKNKEKLSKAEKTRLLYCENYLAEHNIIIERETNK